ncbi:MAG: hypothetical protein JXA30_01160, partial [Deltaproteobacteria bacterium]|nr:hypothetical protein [Deltaproteobacteria bacterium]
VRCRLISAGQARALQRFHVRRLILVNAYDGQGQVGLLSGIFICSPRLFENVHLTFLFSRYELRFNPFAAIER